MTDPVLEELGYYLLAGAGGEGPATLMDEARRGEELGFGTAFISERWNVKEASSLVGAACAVTSRMQIATAATNHNTRHPLITGSWATTMHRLSGGRFTLGIGRGVALEFARAGITVNAICPGYTETPLLERAVDNITAKTKRSRDEARTALATSNPQGRLVTPDEVADTVLWLASAGAHSITGQAIVIAGGEVMAG